MANKNNHKDTLAELKAIAELMEKKDISLVKIQNGNNIIEVARGGYGMSHSMPASQPMPTAAVASVVHTTTAAPASAPAAAAPVDLVGTVKSPVVGTVYLSPKPGEPNFIKVGDKVKQGAVLMIVEAMKVMNQITAPKAGVVTAVLVDNEDPVEFGQPLVAIS